MNYEENNINYNANVNSYFIFRILSVDKDYSFMTLLKGLDTIEFTEFDWQKLQEIFETLNFQDIWSEIGNVWENVNGLFGFFYAVGMSFKAIWDSIVQIGQMIWGTLTFTFEFIGFLFYNLIAFVKFAFTYIFVS